MKLRDLEERTSFISYLKDRGITSVFHYIPLHSSPAGMRFGHFDGDDQYTTSESNRLARLPLYFNLEKKDLDYIISSIYSFFDSSAAC